MNKPNLSIYPESHRTPFWLVFWMAIFGIAMVLFTLWSSYRSVCDKDPTWLFIVIAIWAVGPPVWFWAEYFGIFMRWGKKESFDLFKYGQQVATAIWAGIFTLLVLFANSGATDPYKEVPSQHRCQQMCGVDTCPRLEQKK